MMAHTSIIVIYMNITVCTYLQLRFSCVTRLSCISFEVGCVHWWRFTGWSKMHPPKLQNTTRRIASAIRLDPHGATRKGGRCTIAGLGRHDAEILKYIEKRCQVSKKWARLNWGLSCWLVWMLSIHVGMSKIHNSWRESQRVTCCYSCGLLCYQWWKLPLVDVLSLTGKVSACFHQMNPHKDEPIQELLCNGYLFLVLYGFFPPKIVSLQTSSNLPHLCKLGTGTFPTHTCWMVISQTF